MHPILHRLWMKWAIIATLLAALLSAGLSVAAYWKTQQRVSEEAAHTTSVIARALSNDLSKALSQGIPIRDLVGLKDWFSDSIAASPTVTGLSVHDYSGQLIDQSGVPSEVLASLANRKTEDQDRIDGWQISTIALTRGLDKTPEGWLHVIGQPPTESHRPWLITLIGTSIVCLLAAWALRLFVRQRLDQPGRALAHNFESLAQGHPVYPSNRLPDGPLKQLVRSLNRRLSDDVNEIDRVMQKAAEVRAAHFDPDILSRADALVEPLRRKATVANAFQTERTMIGSSRLGLLGRLSWASSLAWLLGASMVMLLVQLQHEPERRQLVRTSRDLLSGQFESTQDAARVRLRTVSDAASSSTALRSALESDQYDEASRVLADLRPEGVTISLMRRSGELLVASPQRVSKPQPDLELLSTTGATPATTFDVWQGQDGRYQSGVIQAMRLKGGESVLVVTTLGLEQSLSDLNRRLNAETALADLRGRPVFEEGSSLITAWRQNEQNGAVTHFDGRPVVIASIPLSTEGGTRLGTLAAAIPRDDEPSQQERLIKLASFLALAATVAGLLVFIIRNLRPVADASRRLSDLADGDTRRINTEPQHSLFNASHRLSASQLESSMDRLGDNIDTLNRFRRARARQGRRQARFIRHQMLQLAQRLEEDDRKAILDDLERIEAGNPADNATLTGALVVKDGGSAHSDDPKAVVDEIGVLALGFQGLLGRVGDQYQQMSKLVVELREALRVKTQFISLQRDIEIASKIQLSFLPNEFNLCSEVDVLGAYRPAKDVGGDFYDVFRLGEHHLAVTIADVSGKGIPAAFFMAVSRTLLRAVSQINEEPAERIARLNDLLAADNRESMFVTLFYAVIDLRDGSMTYTNAGHNPPYLLRKDGRVEALPSSHCIALAMMEGMPYTQQQAQLGVGDALFLFTDGVTEAFNPQEQMFGEQGLEALLARIGTLPVDEITARTFEAVKTFEDGGPQSDDVTCLVARFVGSQT